MPQKPRLTFTPQPDVFEAVHFIAVLAGVPVGRVVAEIFERCGPFVLESARLLEQLDLARQGIGQAVASLPPVDPIASAVDSSVEALRVLLVDGNTLLDLHRRSLAPPEAVQGVAPPIPAHLKGKARKEFMHGLKLSRVRRL